MAESANYVASEHLETLVRLKKEHPAARIVTDVGRSMFSGWGDLVEIKYHEDADAIELIFD